MSTHTAPTHLRLTHINATEGHIFSEYDTPLTEHDAGLILDEDGRVIMGELYRTGRDEYGRCTGKIYVDTDDGVRHVGYVFIQRNHYEDTGEPYTRETWVALVAKSTEYVGA